MAQTKTTNFGTRQYPAVFYTKATYADFAVTVKWRPVSGQIDASGGIVFRARDGANYYVVRGNSLESNFGLYKCVDGMRIPIAFREPIDRPALNEWHTMRVVCDGNRIRAWMDGTLMIDGRDDLYDKGMVGLWTKADAVTYFDDFIITTRDDEEEAAAPSSWSHVTVVLVAIAGAACVFLLGFFFPRRSPASPEQGGGS